MTLLTALQLQQRIQALYAVRTVIVRSFRSIECLKPALRKRKGMSAGKACDNICSHSWERPRLGEVWPSISPISLCYSWNCEIQLADDPHRQPLSDAGKGQQPTSVGTMGALRFFTGATTARPTNVTFYFPGYIRAETAILLITRFTLSRWRWYLLTCVNHMTIDYTYTW
jgi:hypothetical protein